jgi:hypothetical protein
MALPLLGAVAAPKRLIADRADDAKSLRRWLKERHIKAVIPSTATRTKPYPLDQRAPERRTQSPPSTKTFLSSAVRPGSPALPGTGSRGTAHCRSVSP